MEVNPITLTTRSLDNLKALFNVIAGLALVESVKAVIKYNSVSGNIKIEYSYIPLLIALFITIIPFHQGASRYLDNKYITNGANLRKLDGLVDLMFFITEGIIFYGAALVISQPKIFFNMLALMFLIDVIWLGLVYISSKDGFQQIKYWLFINTIAILILLIFNYGNFITVDFVKWSILSFLLIIRSIFDYASSWEFYWPTKG
jgi:hypothetical protein